MTNEIEMQLKQTEGVQFFTDNEGNAGVSQRGLAKLCGIHAGSSKREIEAILSELGIAYSAEEMAQTYTIKGSKTAPKFTKIYNADLCVKVITYAATMLRNPEAIFTLSKFVAIGFTKWVQTITGFEPAKAVSAQVELTELEMAERYVKLLKEKAETIAYLGDKPGLAHKMAQAHQPKALPCELMTFDELCDLRGVTRFALNQKRELSRKLSNSVQNDTLVQVGTKTVIDSGKGKNRYYQVKAYSVEAIPTFDNLIKATN